MDRSLTCLRCGTEMVRVGARKFQMGQETRFFDSHLWEGAMELEVFGCPPLWQGGALLGKSPGVGRRV